MVREGFLPSRCHLLIDWDIYYPAGDVRHARLTVRWRVRSDRPDQASWVVTSGSQRLEYL